MVLCTRERCCCCCCLLTFCPSLSLSCACADAVLSVAVHPTNADLFASGGCDDKAYVWDAKTGEALYALEDHKDSVIAVAFNHDGKYIATG